MRIVETLLAHAPQIARRRCRRHIAGLACAVLLVGTGSALAQTALGGSISGRVADEQDGALPAAIVTAVADPAMPPHVAFTDGVGRYRLVNLLPGSYVVTVARDGFARTVRTEVIAREGLNLDVDITLIVGPIDEIVTIGADTPLLEWKTTTNAVNISGEFQRTLPLSSARGWADFLQVTPSVVVTQARFPSYTLHGTGNASGVYLVDGADVSSVLQGSTLYAQFATEAFADIQVKTGGVDASSPLGLGPVVNVVTISGSNRFRGVAAVAYQPRAWNGNNAATGTSVAIGVRQGEFALGGPLRRDAWWFFGAGRLVRNNTGVSRSPLQLEALKALVPGFEPFDNHASGQIVFGKLTGELTPRHHVLLSSSRDIMALGGAQPNEAAMFRELRVGGPASHARLSSVWTSSLLTRASVAYNGRQQRNVNLRSDVAGINIYERVFASGGRLIGSGLLASLNASPFSAIEFPVHNWTGAGDLTWHRAGHAGSLEFQAGVYLHRRHNEWVVKYNANGYQLEEWVLRDPANLAAGAAPFHRQVFDAEQLTQTRVDSSDTAVYAQNFWRATPRLSIGTGIRVDWVRRRDRLFDVGTQRSTEVGPRIGLNYAPTSRSSARVTWNRVHDNLTVNETQAGSNVAGLADRYDVDGSGDFVAVFITPPSIFASPNLRIDLPRYHQPYADEVMLDYHQQLPGRTAVRAGLLRREYRRRPAAVEVNGIYENGVFAGYREMSQNAIYQLTSNVWNWPVTTALTVDASKTTQQLQLLAAYTREWNRLKGTWQPNDPASFIQPEAFANRGGIGFVSGCTSGPCPDSDSFLGLTSSGSWRAHVAKIAASYVGPWRLRMATTYTFQSGPPSGPILTRLATADPRFGAPTIALPNGRVVSNPLGTPIRFAHATRAEAQFELAPLHLWNLRIGRRLRVGSRELELTLDVVNVPNHDADQTLQNGANQQYNLFFRQGATRQFPRAMQIAARFAF